jgi:hypothetical protein
VLKYCAGIVVSDDRVRDAFRRIAPESESSDEDSFEDDSGSSSSESEPELVDSEIEEGSQSSDSKNEPINEEEEEAEYYDSDEESSSEGEAVTSILAKRKFGGFDAVERKAAKQAAEVTVDKHGERQ